MAQIVYLNVQIIIMLIPILEQDYVFSYVLQVMFQQQHQICMGILQHVHV